MALVYSVLRSVAVLLATLMACPALPQPPTQPPPEEQALRGPPIDEGLVRTLIRRKLSGEFIRIEGRPEEAALALLELSADSRQRAGEVGDRYSNALGTLLVDQIDLLRDSADALEARNTPKAQALMRDLYDRFDPDQPKDPLIKPLTETLAPAEHAELVRLVDEYWRAWVDWELRRAKDRSEDARRQTEKRLAFQIFQEELRRAYDRTIRPYRERIERIYQTVDPTQEQRTAIREIVIDFIRQTRLKPTQEQRGAAAKRIYDALDEERRVKLFELLLMQT